MYILVWIQFIINKIHRIASIKIMQNLNEFNDQHLQQNEFNSSNQHSLPFIYQQFSPSDPSHPYQSSQTLQPPSPQKISYLHTLQNQNKSMIAHIRSLSQSLDKQISAMKFNIHPNGQGLGQGYFKPQVPTKRNGVEKLYQQLEGYRVQVQRKIMQKRSIEDLMEKEAMLKAEKKQRYLRYQQKIRMKEKYQRVLEGKRKAEEFMDKSKIIRIGKQQCEREVSDLKSKIRDQLKDIVKQREKNVRLMKLRKDQKQKQQLERKCQPTQNKEFSEEEKQYQQLKKQYEKLGKNIQVLKTKIANSKGKYNQQCLLYSENRKNLQKLKNKINELAKL